MILTFLRGFSFGFAPLLLFGSLYSPIGIPAYWTSASFYVAQGFAQIEIFDP